MWILLHWICCTNALPGIPVLQKKEKKKKETDLLKLQFPEEVSTVMLGYQPNMALISAAQMWHSMY